MIQVLLKTKDGLEIEGTLLKQLKDTQIVYSQNRIALADNSGIITETIVDYCLIPDKDLQWAP